MRRSAKVWSSVVVATVLQGSALHAVRAEERPEVLPVATRYTGPPLWRVSKGGHDLWLFGTLSVVPDDARFVPTAVERAIADADVVLSSPGVRATPSLKPIALVRLWRRVRELSVNAGGATLTEVLPPDVYRRYAVLRDRYLKRDRNLETLRPIVVAGRLYEAAVESMGLVSSRDVDNGIERAARRSGAALLDAKLHADPEALLEAAASTPPAAEIDCFAKVLAAIEEDERRLPPRARAWAAGDVAALRRFEYPDIRRECLAFPGWPAALGAALDDAENLWLESADIALSRNESTFATVDLRDLIRSDGLLARLRARGYEVTAPQP